MRAPDAGYTRRKFGRRADIPAIPVHDPIETVRIYHRNLNRFVADAARLFGSRSFCKRVRERASPRWPMFVTMQENRSLTVTAP